MKKCGVREQRRRTRERANLDRASGVLPEESAGSHGGNRASRGNEGSGKHLEQNDQEWDIRAHIVQTNLKQGEFEKEA